MTPLKLVALDDQDLGIISAHVQDAVTKVGDLQFLPARKQFLAPMNRFVWETQTARSAQSAERRNGVLHFDRVVSVRSSGIDKTRKDDVLVLLAVTFEPGDAPAGTVQLTFAAGATLRLEVECIEARLTDLGGAWEASSRPSHPA